MLKIKCTFDKFLELAATSVRSPAMNGKYSTQKQQKHP